MKSIIPKFCSIMISLMSLVSLTMGQNKNPTVWPYGGSVDSAGNKWLLDLSKTDLDKSSEKLDSSVSSAKVTSLAPNSENPPLILTNALFDGSHFKEIADFQRAHFKCVAKFSNSRFDSLADFSYALFDSLAHFENTDFNGETFFVGAQFKNGVSFVNPRTVFPLQRTTFKKNVEFFMCFFDEAGNFYGAEFIGEKIRFWGSHFQKDADFTKTKFKNIADFSFVKFNGSVSFLEAEFDSLNLTESLFNGEIHLGASGKRQIVDLRQSHFTEKAKIELHTIINLYLQAEKVRHIELANDLSWNANLSIINHLKETTFRNSKEAHFELDYIFAKSTMYLTPGYIQPPHIMALERQPIQITMLPKWILNTLYYLTMGLGYRPFRLGYWVLGLIALFTGIYFKKFPQNINEYIKVNYTHGGQKRLKPNKFGTLVNCIYFSSMVLLTFRLKGNILTHFDDQQKKWILSEWLFGFLILISFFTLSESGSILQTLKNLFIG